METKRVRLRPVVASDYDFLYLVAVDPRVAYRWRFRGTTPSPQQFVQELHLGVLCQFLVETTSKGERVGLVVAYQPDTSNGTVYLALVASPAHEASGLMIEAAAVFLKYLFDTWPLRRVYAEVPGYSFTQFAAGLGQYFVEEGRLEEHSFHDGTYWPLHLLTIEREAWKKQEARVLPILRGNP